MKFGVCEIAVVTTELPPPRAKSATSSPNFERIVSLRSI